MVNAGCAKSAHMSHIINGTAGVSLPALDLICKTLGVTLSEFFRPFAYNEHPTPLYLQEFASLCADLEPADVDVLSTSVRYIKSLKQALPTAPSAVPLVKPVPVKSDEIYHTVRVHGEAAAGLPLYSEADADDVVELPSKYADQEHYRVIRARGDSMEPKIYTGDIVVAEIGVKPFNGQMALVYLAGLADDEYTIKRVYYDNGRIILRSYNSVYPDMIHTPEEIRSCEAIAKVFGKGSAE